ncbi:cysteine desulfurase family protein [Natranaerobius thermophilus]|uniref:cysteine desulfurase n=1 Tax=Natranaerobius thermophilus (strain ATCC BAA-1301 / DSM 18059 / JW/NM-WN-LF) TaxID=457570 RepID=B2A0N7_NATTJ|nr:cysteine desulfurase family protein [Natranaerobius thermophilus]ACB85917.1 aminotransferase class V [Natranaerobius thermophilus JW/NM-WN-LF]
MGSRKIYLDNSATTKVDKEVADVVYKIMTEGYGNPSSLHGLGVTAEDNITKVRSFLMKALKASQGELIFTSGGTEANNLAIRGVAYRENRQGNHLITTEVEHPSVLEVFNSLEDQGYQVTYLPVDHKGIIDLYQLQQAVNDDTILVSIQAVNNETGTIQPVKEAAKLVKDVSHKPVFHCDAVQAVGKIELAPEDWGIDLLTVSAHKFHGPKGVGSLYISPRTRLKPLFYGGGQEQDLRPGTENVPGITGMGKALEKMLKNREQFKELYSLKKHLYDKITLKLGNEVMLIGPEIQEGVPYIMSLAFSGVKAEVMIHALEKRGVYVSAGSACTSNKEGESHVLKAMKIPDDFREGTIRLSFSYHHTMDEIDYAADQVIGVYQELKQYGRR